MSKHWAGSGLLLPAPRTERSRSSRIAVVGCSHHTAPISVREQIVFSSEQCIQALGQFRRAFPQTDAAILSTCNRTELYWARPRHGPESTDHALRFLADFHGVPPERVRAHSYGHTDSVAIRHLFRVASSLDSMILGETEILRQVRQALKLAEEAGTMGATLRRIFEQSISTAREVHGATGISDGPASLEGVALRFFRQTFADAGNRAVLVIGAGHVAQRVVEGILRFGAARCRIINRSPERALRQAARLGAVAESFDDMDRLVHSADLVVSATSAPTPIMDADRYCAGRGPGHGRRQLILDLGVPRDFEAPIGRIPGVILRNLDDLQAEAERIMGNRQAEVGRCEQIIDRRVAIRIADLCKRGLTGPGGRASIPRAVPVVAAGPAR